MDSMYETQIFELRNEAQPSCKLCTSTLYTVFTYVNATKETSENVTQPGIEPESPDNRPDALATRLLSPPHRQQKHNVTYGG